MTAEQLAPFDLCGPLPGIGVTVLEASAGTGKTFTIAALTARFVADGIPIDDILAVTFTRMATAELRDRVPPGWSPRRSDLACFSTSAWIRRQTIEWPACSHSGPRTKWCGGGDGWPMRWPCSMRPLSRRPTGSASWSWPAWEWQDGLAWGRL